MQSAMQQQAALAGASVVLSGMFGAFEGAGIHQGKSAVRASVAEHGGKVVGAISKKTTFLVAGSAPGMAKVAEAVRLGVPVLSYTGLAQVITGTSVSDAQRADIAEFSTGFNGENGKALRTADAELDKLRAAAAGKKRPADAPTGESEPKKPKVEE